MVKSGFLSSEFFVVAVNLVGCLLPSLQNHSNPILQVAAAVLSGLYVLGRSYVKAK